ncbi:MAG: A24 family peptidase [Pseudomonadota bacterium]
MLDQLPQPLLFGIVAVFGMTIGSFLNVVMARLPVMMQRQWEANCREVSGEESPPSAQPPFNLMVPRSTCPSCGHMITAFENIPVVSYLVLRGRCSGCKTRISARYPSVEILTGLMCMVVFWRFGLTPVGLGAMVLTFGLIALSFIDVDHQLLPDDITLPFLWLGLLFNLLWPGLASIQDAVIGAIAGYLSLWMVFHAFKLLTGKEGMGYGDFKLLAMLGAWLGWQALPGIIFLSSLVGAVVGVSLIAFRGHDRAIPIPFGPYLALAGWLWLLAGNDLASWYMGLLAPPPELR